MEDVKRVKSTTVFHQSHIIFSTHSGIDHFQSTDSLTPITLYYIHVFILDQYRQNKRNRNRKQPFWLLNKMQMSAAVLGTLV